MTIDTITRSLRERFAQPLKDCYDRRIIFWYDSEREFESMLDELDLPDVKILKPESLRTEMIEKLKNTLKDMKA